MAAATALIVRAPSRTQARIAPFVTPLQLHTWTSSASSATLVAGGGAPRSNSNETRSSGSTMPRSKACMRNDTLPTSPSSVAPTSLPSRTITHLYTRRLGSENVTTSSSSRSGAASPIVASSMPDTLSFVASFEPW
ncbi:MAG: hypothetical protein QOG56_1043 [Solirubrobacteraceae bacterium]|nr:hypothetical protein [Solirubrobacteraceae bacterium]